MSTIASHSPLNISETVTAISYWWSLPPNGLWGIKWLRDRWRHMTPKGQTRDPERNISILENSWRYYLATIANYYRHRQFAVSQ